MNKCQICNANKAKGFYNIVDRNNLVYGAKACYSCFVEVVTALVDPELISWKFEH